MNPREFLLGLERFGIKLGLDNIRRLCAELGEPHLEVPVVHVAGTNGKGSVLALLDAILRESGLSTGRYTSPHLVRLNERFLLNGEPVSDGELDAALARVEAVARRMEPPPTFFEAVTAAAFLWFAERRPDVALIEVGLGGRFDATNVVEPLACAITSLSLEHTEHLGDTIDKIAFEKAGIIKPGVPVVCAAAPGPALSVLLRRAAEEEAPMLLAGRDFNHTFHDGLLVYDGSPFPLRGVPVALPGPWQGENAAVTVALAGQLGGLVPGLTPETVARGLAQATWPCRLEKVLDNPPVFIDVAHNPDGARRLAGAMAPSVVLLAVSADKDAATMLRHLAPKTRMLVISRYEGRRAATVGALAAAATELGLPHIIVEPLDAAVDHALTLASTDTPLVITGSIFSAGEARTRLVERHGARPLSFGTHPANLENKPDA